MDDLTNPLYVEALSNVMFFCPVLMLFILLFNISAWDAAQPFVDDRRPAKWSTRCEYSLCALLTSLIMDIGLFSLGNLHQIWYNANAWRHVGGWVDPYGYFVFASVMLGAIAPAIFVANIAYLITVVRRRENRQKNERMSYFTFAWPRH